MKRLIQLLMQNSAERQSGVRFASTDGQANVYLKGIIASEYGASAADLRAALDQAGGADVRMHINSPGGDVFEAREMQAVMVGYAGKITAAIEGLAASAATIVSMSATRVEMMKGSRYMIHNGWSLAMGDKNEMRSVADLLDAFDQELAGEYAARTGVAASQAAAWMNAETWFNADQALASKFVDALFDNTKNESVARWNLSAYANAPADEPAPAPAPDYAAIRELQARRLKLLEIA